MAYIYKDEPIYIEKIGGEKFLFVTAGDDLFEGQIIDENGKRIKKCPLNHHNAEVLRKIFPFTAPVSVLRNKKSFGLGDRLGIVSPGHISLFKRYPEYKPVLAQQSMRELNLTGRTYENVLDDVTYAVFAEEYECGFGADGDHLKTAADIKYALDCGYTMITLDCSDHIDNTVAKLTDAEAEEKCLLDTEIKDRYVGKTFMVEGNSLSFDLLTLKRIVLTYKKAIDFAAEIYGMFFEGDDVKADFELSIDETLTPTTPLEHFFVANELKRMGITPATVAPRFCGEFQKGIDYIGDIAQFKKEFSVHAAIARHFGYKISVHSGSDKYSVFETVGKETQGCFHVKTAGTNWLEAVRVIAKRDPGLYREIHSYARSVLDEARKYYHIGADTAKISDVNSLSDAELPALMDKPDSRQVIHITYGLILNAKNDDGSLKFKNRMYKLWSDNEADLLECAAENIEKHLKLLGSAD